MFIHGTPFIRTGTVSKQADTNRFIENEIEQTDDGRFVWSYDVEEGKQVNKALLVQHEFFSRWRQQGRSFRWFTILKDRLFWFRPSFYLLLLRRPQS